MALTSTQFATVDVDLERESSLPKSNRRTDLPVLLLHNLDDAWEPADLEKALDEVDALETAMRKEGHPVINVPVYGADLEHLLSQFDPDEHIVFNGCEGFAGIPLSESLVAETLESMKFTYTGSTPDVLDTGWNKAKVKRLLRSGGVSSPSWKVFDSPQPDGWRAFPAIVKPAREHSSCGVTREAVALSPEKLYSRIAYVLEAFHQPAIVEDFIDGREFHVSIWGNHQLEMLPPAEMDFSAFRDVQDRLCTFDSKFRPGSRAYEQISVRIPASLTKAESEALERTALRAYRVIGCRDYARLDIRVRNGVFYVLDVNPNPDISSDTSMAFAAELAGYTYGAMLSQMVNIAAHRHPVFRR